MILYMATWLSEKAQREVLNHCEKRERLLSYWFIKSSKESFIEYVESINKGESKW